MVRNKAVLFFSLLAFMAGSVSMSAYALEDGAYTVSRTTSYANPETGQIVDGGSDEALGNSMITGIVEDHVLVEQTGGKTYVTVGLGLASNVSNVRMQVQTSSGGGFKNVSLTKTGSCSRDGDTCNHYRFEVVDPSYLISPIMYVGPMGRDVQFFIRLNMSSATAGTGNFVSQMIPQESSSSGSSSASSGNGSATDDASDNGDEAAQEEEEPEEEPEEIEEEREIIPVDIPDNLMDDVEGLRIYEVETEPEEESEESEEEPEEEDSGVGVYVAGAAVVLAAAGGGGFWFWRRRKGGI